MDPHQHTGVAVPFPAADKPRILFVDDHPEYIQPLGAILSDEFDVAVVPSGTEALDLAQRMPPALVLADVVMPRLDGIGLLKALRQDPRTRTVPVILVSGRAPEEARAEAFECGADGYLSKPFTMREVRARIRSALEGTKLRATAARAEALAQAEEAATRERADLLESITDAFYALDTQWRFVYVNNRAIEHFGRSREDCSDESSGMPTRQARAPRSSRISNGPCASKAL